MDSFFEYYLACEEIEIPSLHELLQPLKQSAFVAYTNGSSEGFPSKMAEKMNTNVKNRMVEFLKKNWVPVMGKAEAEREKNQKHMINERTRREKERQSYEGLHKLLPHGTKREKKSIVQMAARKIEELKREKAKLEKRNQELQKALAVENNKASSSKTKDEANINIRVAYPSSGIDSMLEVLKCLKNNDSTAISIQSKFSTLQFSAVLQIQTSVGAAEVENAVQRTLFEVERKFRCPNLNSEEYKLLCAQTSNS